MPITLAVFGNPLLETAELFGDGRWTGTGLKNWERRDVDDWLDAAREANTKRFAALEPVAGKSNQRWKLGNWVSAMSSSESPGRRPVIPAREARQGVTGHNVRFVLGFSLAAIVIVLAIIWIVYFA